ncbi:hypothetical protein V3H18_10695 [Methylocystis sp. 9N]|uniref:Uncharacterized protein n=1 Tax=Methylocystis borbori TaxID=3118750 RepID=A0ABU7XKH9_9HYPH
MRWEPRLKTPLGNVIASAYDYVVLENLGFHVDYDSTLGKQIESLRVSEKSLKLPDQNRLDSVVEKTSKAIEAIHRPIVSSRSAESAELKLSYSGKPTTIKFDKETYDYVSYSSISDISHKHEGRISSYNINTYKGRIFLAEYNRSLPFELAETARVDRVISLVTRSLYRSANRNTGDPQLRIKALEVLSRSGQLKKLLIVELTE